MSFRLAAPNQTTVTGVLKAGAVVSLTFDPPSAKSAFKLMSCQA